LVTRLVDYPRLAKPQKEYASPETESPPPGDHVVLEALHNAHRAQSGAN
jgi:hypothetical protein